MTKPIWNTPAGLLTTASELVSISLPLSATGTGITYSIISGELPKGLTLSNNAIVGTPQAVLNTTRSKFVVRAKNDSGVADRTFLLDVEGADAPIWQTPSGYLPAGYNGEGFVFNGQYVKIAVTATNVQSGTAPTKYYIADNRGTLPRGLELSQDGVISGYVAEELPIGTPPKRFTFEITATDSIGTSTRFFRLIAVNPDYFRADNTYLNFSTTFVTSTATTVAINSGTTVFSSAVNLPNNFPFNSLEPFDLLITPTGLPVGGRIINITTNSFTINTATTASISIGSTLTVVRPSVGFDILSGYVVTNDASYLQPPQFVNGTDLGTVRASNNETVDVRAYDPAPYRGPVVYNLVTGTTVFTQLPENLKLESEKGYIYGFIPYQPAYTRNYVLTVQATKIDNITNVKVTATNTFTLAVKGEVESSIEWISNSDLGSIETGITSELAVKAKQIASDYPVKYEITGGSLPSGLNLARDGSIYGKADYGSTGTYTFTVLASDVYDLSWIYRDFTLNVTESSDKEYTSIYFKPFFSLDKRVQYQEFVTDSFIFDPNLIYRFYDPNFGVQPEIKLVLDFGIEQINLSHYVSALRENFYRRRFYFGDIKKAIAKDNKGNIVYELVYADVADDGMTSDGKSVAHTFYTEKDIYYPSSVNNMRRQLQLIPLNDGTYISVREDLQPRFMDTIQPGSFDFPGYMRVIPICYAIPGEGDRIISRIKLRGFDFKKFDFEVDRIVVENSADNNSAKYLIFDRQSIADSVETDNYLFGLDWAAVPELTVRLDDEDDTPLTRT